MDGPNEFISNQLEFWIKNKIKFDPLVAIETQSEEYVGFNNTIKIGNSLWLEGLRVALKFRNNQVATKLIEKSLSLLSNTTFQTIGFATRNNNYPMLKLANKLQFVTNNEQIVFIKRNNENFLDKTNLIQDIKKIANREEFYNKISQKNNHQIFTSFFKVPANTEGKQIFLNIEIFESQNCYLLYEKNHNEATKKRGIFTVYLKYPLAYDILLDELKKLGHTKILSQYPSYSFALNKTELAFNDNLIQTAEEYNFEVHILRFFEKNN